MSSHEQPIWYYGSAEGERVGPVSIRELSSLAGQGKVGPKTLVWSPGYPDWISAEQIADLLVSARETVPTIPGVPAEPETSGGPPADAVADVPTANTSVPDKAATASETGSAIAPALELKPRKGSYVLPRISLSWLFFLAISAATAAALVAAEQLPWPAAAVFAVGAVLSVISSFASYRKERYEILESRVLCHRGGLMSDQTTELEVRNITHVKLKLPWLRYKFHGVGNVILETAGSAQPVVMRSIPDPEAVYAGLQERMKRNGYDLTQRQLLHEEKPAMIGILAEGLGTIGGAIVAILYSGVVITGAREAAKSATFDAIAFAGLGFAAIALIAFVIVRFLDFRRRTYRVFNDVVVYDEGFLTRHNAFIPYENIADATTNCTFIDRLFGLYDVQVSCQGSSKEIKFRRLKHGATLSAAIDQLVVFAREKKKPAAVKSALAARIHPRRGEPEAIPSGEAMVAELRMHAGRTVVPLLFLFPLLPIWILVMIQAGIRLMSTQYSVRPGSVRHAYRFLTLIDREFAYDKITGVVIKRNPWDRMFGTMTIKFWSIGSGQPIEFAHVHASQFDVAALLRQAGIPAPSPEPFEARASFSLFAWLRGGLKFLPWLGLVIAAIVFVAMQIDPVLYYLLLLPVLVSLGCCFYAILHTSRQRLRFHDHFVEAEQGVIAKRHYLARYGNIKRTKFTRYPGGETGDLEIFVAGEEEIQQAGQQKKGLQKVMRPCSFTTRLLPAVGDTGLLLDDILCGRVDPAPQAVTAGPLELLLESRRAAGNAVVKLVLLSILLFPLIVLLPITIPLTVMRVKRWRYRVEAARIVTTWGLLYRSETSILLDRVDSLQQSQGPLNKMFKNGNVTIMTAGSSKPDFKILDSPGYLELYRIIRERSE